jgi:ketosteroid isomerase-like protein
MPSRHSAPPRVARPLLAVALPATLGAAAALTPAAVAAQGFFRGEVLAGVPGQSTHKRDATSGHFSLAASSAGAGAAISANGRTGRLGVPATTEARNEVAQGTRTWTTELVVTRATGLGTLPPIPLYLNGSFGRTVPTDTVSMRPLPARSRPHHARRTARAFAVALAASALGRDAAAQPTAAQRAVAARATPDTAAVLAPVRAFIDAFNRSAPAAPAEAFTADVIITDDLPPFRWTGADALAQWWTALFGTSPAQRADFARMQRRLLLGPARHVFVTGDDGYVTMPVTMTAVDPRSGRPLTVAGDLALTLRRVDGRWRLSSHAWARRDTAS